jgi:hypothetical protein
MRFRYRDTHGKTVSLPDVASLLEAIRAGDITHDTPLAVGDDRAWHRADSVAAYQEALAALARAGDAPRAVPRPVSRVPERPASAPWYRLRAVRIAVPAAVVVAILLGAGLRIRYLERVAEAERLAAAAADRAGRVRQAAEALSVEAADSAALAIAALQAWVSRQRFDQRLRGAALRNPAALRDARAAAAALRAEVDGLVAGAGALSARLTARADSIETATAGLDGLLVAAEDGLTGWGRDLAGYAALERGVAAVLDSVAAFALERQASFVIREGQPVFLSRADGAQLSQLLDHVAELAGREASWAREVQGKRPHWMAALPDSGRPAFGQAVLRAP